LPSWQCAAVYTVDDRRSAHADRAALSRAPLHGDCSGAAGLRACISRGWPAARDSDRQRGPCATAAMHGLSHRNTCWMRLGITHQRVHPGQPQENGVHERIHRTLTRRALTPVHRTGGAQQTPFDAFQLEYNTERPHEALGQDPAASRYLPSPRPIPHACRCPSTPGIPLSAAPALHQECPCRPVHRSGRNR